jgi:hypothetical protein
MKSIGIVFILLFSVSFTSCKKEEKDNSEDALAIGNQFGGGIIFYIDNSGEHGLVAAESNQSNAIRWSNGTNVLIDSTGNAVGEGQKNTSRITTIHGAGDYAAKLCDELTLNGYSDWFLPSKNELNLLFIKKSHFSGLVDGYYWTSTEYNAENAWNQYFPFGPQYYANKLDSACVRAIRAF